MVSRDELDELVDGLIDGWCERRNLCALRLVLQGYPLGSGLTDDWHRLRDALTFVRADCRDVLQPDESDRLERAIAMVDLALTRD
jgi:hypothetical protein